MFKVLLKVRSSYCGLGQNPKPKSDLKQKDFPSPKATRHQRDIGTQGSSHFISHCQCHAREERGVFSTYPGQGAVPPSLAVGWAHSTSLVCLAWWCSLLLHVLTGAKGLEGGVTEQRLNSVARHHLSVPRPFSPKPLMTQLPWTT